MSVKRVPNKNSSLSLTLSTQLGVRIFWPDIDQLITSNTNRMSASNKISVYRNVQIERRQHSELLALKYGHTICAYMCQQKYIPLTVTLHLVVASQAHWPVVKIAHFNDKCSPLSQERV